MTLTSSCRCVYLVFVVCQWGILFVANLLLYLFLANFLIEYSSSFPLASKRYLYALYRVCLERAFKLYSTQLLILVIVLHTPLSTPILPCLLSTLFLVLSPGVHSINTSFCVFVFPVFSNFSPSPILFLSLSLCICFPCVCDDDDLRSLPTFCITNIPFFRSLSTFSDYLGFNLYVYSIVFSLFPAICRRI